MCRRRLGIAVCASTALAIRAGLHLGEIERQGDDVVGLAVHIGARVAELAKVNEILLSQTVRDVLLGAGVQLTDRGAHALRGVPGEWRLFAVGDGAVGSRLPRSTIR
jgi:class 3 adenylate cyclase